MFSLRTNDSVEHKKDKSIEGFVNQSWRTKKSTNRQNKRPFAVQKRKGLSADGSFRARSDQFSSPEALCWMAEMDVLFEIDDRLGDRNSNAEDYHHHFHRVRENVFVSFDVVFFSFRFACHIDTSEELPGRKQFIAHVTVDENNDNAFSLNVYLYPWTENWCTTRERSAWCTLLSICSRTP